MLRLDFVTAAVRFVVFWASICATVAQPQYQNPVIPGDHPDPSIIRVGKDFWATSTSSEWGPEFPLLHSTDLVNWETTGVVFPHRPAWAVANFWAPEISEYKGHYFVYYVGRKRGGPLAVAAATADKPGGPYTDHGPLVAQEVGSIDPVAATDENGKRYLVWKEDGNSQKRPTVIWAQPLSDGGVKLTGQPRELLRNDAAWEGAVVEGPFVLRHGDWFYLFYSGGACCGRECSYGLGVARARHLLGPWEKNPANPIIAGNTGWKCPGHGSVVADEKGRYWLLYHGYSTTNFVFTGREGLLDEVTFGDDGWPTINRGQGPAISAPSPFGALQKHQTSFQERFGSTLGPGWQWPQDDEPEVRMMQLPNSGGPCLGLVARAQSTNDLVGAILARPTTSGDYTAIAEVLLPSSKIESMAGLAAIGDRANAAGLAVGNGKLVLWRRDKGEHKILAQSKAPELQSFYLRLIASKGSSFQFSFSPDGKQWTSIGAPQNGDNFAPWDRSIRVGLTAGAVENATGQSQFGNNGFQGLFREFKLVDSRE